MTRIFPLLWPVGLILCCCWSQTGGTMQIKLTGKLPRAIETPVELKCETDYMQAGIFWVRQKADLSTHFILHVSSRSTLTPESVRGYTASRTSNGYLLKITRFREEYEGTYYCVLIRNQVLHFSSGLKLYIPVFSTVPPQLPTSSAGLIETMERTKPTVPDPDKDVAFPCKLYIWAPLTGGCCLLLVMLIITLSVCCDPRRRRRRCRCKRPLNGTNGTVTMSRLIT